MTDGSAYELVDNNQFGTHRDALRWLAATYDKPLDVATGFLGLGGLDALAQIIETQPKHVRLLLGAAPEPGALANEALPEAGSAVRDRFEASLDALRRERDFQSFPPLRKAVLERVAAFLRRDDTQVKRFTERFLHGKAYLLGILPPSGFAQGAALITSANLTSAGLTRNLELGAVHYQPTAVTLALRWFEGLWTRASDFREELLDLLLPALPETDPQTVFLRALLELYGDSLPEEPVEAGRPGGDLTQFQRDGYDRAQGILERYHGVIYADGVGTGKTLIGLEFIRNYARDKGLHTLIISPAQLRDRMWKRRLDEYNLPGQVLSYQELALDRQLLPSRPGARRVLNVDKEIYRLVIVDEAHAFREPDTYWYEALDRLMGGTSKDLVLLTATPVNNGLWDIHSLLLLFGRHDGAFAEPPLRIRNLRKFFREAGASDPDDLSEDRLFPLIDAVAVRRDRAFLEKHYPNDTFADGTPVRFPRPLLGERRYDLDQAYPGVVREIVKAIESLTMARYRPTAYRSEGQHEAADENALAGLIQSGLLKRFESSWHSALITARRMRDANAIVVEGIQTHGLIPPLSTLRALAAEVSGGTPLGEVVVEALAEDGALPADEFNDKFLPDIKADLNTLEEIASKLEALGKLPDPKLEKLWEILGSTPARKVAIFTSFADSGLYLTEALDREPRRAAGRKWTVVIGNETDPEARERQLERFCPHSVTEDPKFSPKDGEVDLLISTDILSEGQNLQEAQSVVSFDMPWNPQRVVQRNGRIIRLKSPHAEVYLYTLLPKQGDLEQMLRLEARLRVKIAAANATFGMETPVIAGIASESKIYADLKGFAERLAEGDVKLLDGEDGGKSGAFVGEEYRAHLRRALAEGQLARLKQLPWGIGAVFVQRSAHLTSFLPKPGVFFACRTRQGERYWRFVRLDGGIIREDLTMLRLIDPGSEPGRALPPNIDLGALFDKAASDICEYHNRLRDPAVIQERLPASQKWALTILRSPEAPHGKEFDDADLALGVGRDLLVRRALRDIQKAHEGQGLSVPDTAKRIVDVVKSFGLAPAKPPAPPSPITREDLGVVCYQVVLPA